MKNWNRLLALFLVFSVMSLAGCFLNNDDDDDYAGALTGAIKVSAVADAGAGTFAPAMRGSISPDLRAAVAAKFEARVKIGAGSPRKFSVDISDDAKKLTLSQTIDSVAAGKQQVTIEIIAKGAPDTTDPILKTIETATVAAGQTNENDIKDAPVTVDTTAKAIAFESWAGKDTKTIDDFAPAQADLTAMATKIQAQVTLQIADPKTDYVIPAEIKTEAKTTADKVVVNDTTPDQIKAAVKTYVENTVKKYAGNITSAESTALGNVMDEDFISSGFNKADYLANTGNETGLTLVSHNPALTKISDSEYKVDVSITFSQNGKQETLNSATDGLIFDGTKFSASTLCPNLADFPVMVKKQSDGSWKITGNRSKLGNFDFHIDFGNVAGRTGSQMWANVEDGKTFKIKSGSVTGGNIPSSVQLGKSNTGDSAWHFWDGSRTSMYPLNGELWGNSVAHAGQKYTLSVTFTDNTTQTFELTVPSLPAGLAAPSSSRVTVKTENGKLNVSWTKNAVAGFHSYEINIFGNTQAQFRVEDENTTTIQIPLSGKDSEGKDYTITTGSTIWFSLYAFVGKGSFSHGEGFNLTVNETSTDPAPDQVKASVDTFLRNSIKLWGGTITSTERTALGNVMADDFIGSGLNKTDFVALTGEEGAMEVTSLEQTLVKLADDLYKVDIKVTFIEGGITKTVNSATDGFAFDGSAPTTFTGNSLNPNLQDFPVLVKKIDGSWKIFGNRSKLGWVGMHIGYQNRAPSVGTSMWLNLEEGKSFKIQSGYATGGAITNSVLFGKYSSDSSEWHFSNGSNVTAYPTDYSLLPASAHSAGQVYSLSVTFVDGSTQTFKLTVPAIPTNLVAPATPNLSVTMAGTNLNLSWTKNEVTGFQEYEVLIWYNNNVYTRRIEDVNTTSLLIPMSGTDGNGNTYALQYGVQYHVSVHAFVGNGNFNHGTGFNYTPRQM